MDLSFFQQNYIIIIILAVVVLMTIIGYVADKKGFGKKKEKDTKTKKDEKMVMEPVTEEMPEIINDVTNTEEPTSLANDFEMPSDIEVKEDNFDTIEPLDNNSFQQPSEFEEASPVESETDMVEEMPAVEANINSIDEDNNLNDTVEENVNEEDLNVSDNVTNDEEPNFEQYKFDTIDDLTTDDSTEEVKEETPVVEKEPVNEVGLDVNSEEEFELPNINEVNEQLSDVDTNDDDVWKF